MATADDILTSATRFMPPCVAGSRHAFTETATVATTTIAFEPGALTSHGWYTFAVSGAFNIVFHSSATITNPTNSSVFPAGVYSWYLTSTMGYAEITPAANGYMYRWKSSQTEY